MRRPAVLAATSAAALVMAVPSLDAGAEPAAPAATRGVTVGDNFFSPKRMTVSRGTTLRFVWRRTRNRHNVTGGGRASRTTRRSGTVVRRTVRRSTTFICTVHPDTMRLRVRVRR